MKGIVRWIAVGFLVGAGVAQAEDLREEDRTIVQVFDAPGYNKDQIFTASRVWIAENFKSAKAVIEYENKDEGTIVGNGRINYPCGSAWSCLAKSDWRVPFTMKMEAKDGRFRLTFTNIHLYWPASFASGIRTPESDFPIARQKDMDVIKPQLLLFGPEIQKQLEAAKASENW